jgi:opacity protein-like surface antigen
LLSRTVRPIEPKTEEEGEAIMSARSLFRGGLAAAFLIASLPAAAQEPQRGYVVGFGGVGATEVTSPYFGGSVGFNVTPDLIITAEVSRSQDVLSNFTKEDLGLAAQSASNEIGLPFSTKVKMPTNFVTGGVRYLIPVSWMARPYVSATAGIAHMTPQPTFTLAGVDVTSISMQQEPLKTAFRNETRPMATVGGGLAVTVARHVTFDVGYLFSGIFINTDYLQDFEVSPHSHSQIYTHRGYVGAGFRF